MSFRARLTLYTAAAIAVTVAAASLAVWVVAKRELLSQFDQTLVQQATQEVHPSQFGVQVYKTLVQPGGAATGPLPVDTHAAQLASGNGSSYFANVTVQKVRLREFVFPLEHGGAVITAIPLAGTERALARIKFWILLVGGFGIGVAAALAAFVASAALRPVRRLTAAAETVPAALVEELAAGGVMMLPLGPHAGTQRLVKLTKTEDGLQREDLIGVRFVPLLPGQAREL